MVVLMHLAVQKDVTESTRNHALCGVTLLGEIVLERTLE